MAFKMRGWSPFAQKKTYGPDVSVEGDLDKKYVPGDTVTTQHATGRGLKNIDGEWTNDWKLVNGEVVSTPGSSEFTEEWTNPETGEVIRDDDYNMPTLTETFFEEGSGGEIYPKSRIL